MQLHTPVFSSHLPLIFCIQGTELTEEEIAFFTEYRPIGTIIIGQNIEVDADNHANIPKLQKLCSQIRTFSPYVLIDQEGGRIQRLKGANCYLAPPPATFTEGISPANIQSKLTALRDNVRSLDRDLLNANINVNCAPCCDLLFDGIASAIGNRSFGTDPDVVEAFSVEWVRQAKSDGIISVLKHCPGHGGTEVDTHLSRPIVRKSLEDLLSTDFKVFESVIGVLKKEHCEDNFWVMVGHMVFEAVDPHFCASQSPEVVKLIRERFNFQGKIVTDCLSMGALGGEWWERVIGSLSAGCDYALLLTGDLTQKRLISQKVREFVNAQSSK
jgi:beta-N-acetylhexosaminidase